MSSYNWQLGKQKILSITFEQEILLPATTYLRIRTSFSVCHTNYCPFSTGVLCTRTNLHSHCEKMEEPMLPSYWITADFVFTEISTTGSLHWDPCLALERSMTKKQSEHTLQLNFILTVGWCIFENTDEDRPPYKFNSRIVVFLPA